MKTSTIKQYGLYIGGKIIDFPQGNDGLKSINPSTGEEFARVQRASAADMNLAVQSARDAFDKTGWPVLTASERGIFLKKIAKIIRDNAKELAQLESLATGKTLKHSTFIDVPTCADTFDYFGSIQQWLKETVNSVDAPVKSMTLREPIGVVACIVPWNYPLIMFSWKTATALAAGNTVIYKTSPLGCASIFRLTELIQNIGLPEGVLNIVVTDDSHVAEKLVQDCRVDMVSFTGSTETGRNVMRTASATVKKLTLELGGKSPNIICSDCHIDAAVGGAMSAIFMNQGQMCTAGSRLIVEESIYDEFIKKLADRTKKLKIGNALDFTTEFGPVISKEHRDRILDFVHQALSEGAQVLCGGKIPVEADAKGFFVEPTILTGVTNNMKCAREEIFGPVLSVIKVKNIKEAVSVANDSVYGLAACIWTKDKAKAERIAKELKCGTVWINTYGGFYNGASFGGYKQSGFGRELGREGLFEYTQSKHVCIDETPGGLPLVAGWF